MKSWAISLAVVFSFCPFHGLAAQDIASKPNAADGLSCAISVSAPADKSKKLIPATLVLTNIGSQPLRVCTWCMAWRGSSPGAFSLVMTPEHWKSAPPSLEQLARQVESIAPGMSVSIPFEIPNTDPWMRTQRGADSTIEITGCYSVGEDFARKLNIWHGSIEAKKITLQFQ